MSSIAVIQLHVGERTAHAGRLLAAAGSGVAAVAEVCEVPFEAALRSSYRRALEIGADWTIMFDGDVLPDASAFPLLVAKATDAPRGVFQVQGTFVDGLMRVIRSGGIRIYSTALLAPALDLVPDNGTQIRPETFVYRAMAERGHPTVMSGILAGAHDFEQFLVDVFRTTFVYAHKHQTNIPDMIALWRLEPDNVDFRVALAGLGAGIAWPGPVSIDAGQLVDEAKRTLGDLGVEERDSLPSVTPRQLQGMLTMASRRLGATNSTLGSLEKTRALWRRRPPALGRAQSVLWASGEGLRVLGKGISNRAIR